MAQARVNRTPAETKIHPMRQSFQDPTLSGAWKERPTLPTVERVSARNRRTALPSLIPPRGGTKGGLACKKHKKNSRAFASFDDPKKQKQARGARLSQAVPRLHAAPARPACPPFKEGQTTKTKTSAPPGGSKNPRPFAGPRSPFPSVSFAVSRHHFSGFTGGHVANRVTTTLLCPHTRHFL